MPLICILDCLSALELIDCLWQILMNVYQKNTSLVITSVQIPLGRLSAAAKSVTAFRLMADVASVWPKFFFFAEVVNVIDRPLC